MNLNDNDIRRILGEEPRQEKSPAIPEWNSISQGVRKQNFFRFGLRHLNIYYALLLFSVSSTAATYWSMPYWKTETATVAKPAVIVPEQTIPEPVEEIAEEEIPILPEKIIEPEKEPAPKKKAIVTPKPVALPTPEPVSLVEPVADSMPTEKKVEQPVMRPKPKPAKKIFVFETDTVVEYDTLVINKKTRRRNK